MVNLENYSDAIEKIADRKTENSSRSVELFFSYDIVNSSLYKDTDFFGWPIVLTSLLTNIQGEVVKRIPEAQLWRVLGDEIIFFVTIRDLEEVYSTIDSIYNVLIESSVKIHKGSFFEGLKGFDKNRIESLKRQNLLGVQATSWLAIVYKGEKEGYRAYDNILNMYNSNDNQRICEFLGQDIDIGFRIGKETQERRLAISVELAKILSYKTEYLSRLHIITYKSLKGVWKNRLYPIIWYHDEVIGGASFEDSFYYDETIYSAISKEYFDNKENSKNNLQSYMYSDVNKALEKIICDQHLQEKIEFIKQTINDTSSDMRAVENEFASKLLEFHCAAVCCDVKNKRVMIAKRKNRNVLSELWEFGCARANPINDLAETIVTDYKNDFGIDIEIILDQEREDKEPVPIALYQINKINKIQKGAIVIAKLVGGFDKINETILQNEKHEEVKWISKEEINDFYEPTIHDFKDTLKKVFEMWDDLFCK